MRYFLFLLFLTLASCALSDPGPVRIEVAVSVTKNTRPCLVRRSIAVIDDLGNEHRAPEGSCNEGVITLPEGRSFAGTEILPHEAIQQVFVYVVP